MILLYTFSSFHSPLLLPLPSPPSLPFPPSLLTITRNSFRHHSEQTRTTHLLAKLGRVDLATKDPLFLPSLPSQETSEQKHTTQHLAKLDVDVVKWQEIYAHTVQHPMTHKTFACSELGPNELTNCYA